MKKVLVTFLMLFSGQIFGDVCIPFSNNYGYSGIKNNVFQLFFDDASFYGVELEPCGGGTPPHRFQHKGAQLAL